MKLTAYLTERRIIREDRRRVRSKYFLFGVPEFTRMFDEQYERRRRMTKAGSQYKRNRI